MKKLFPENQDSQKGMLKLLDKKGFYIVLILCIAIVGAVAVFVTTYDIPSNNSDYDSQKLIPEEGDDKVADAGEKLVAQSSVSTTPEPVQQKGNVTKPSETKKPVVESNAPKASPTTKGTKSSTPAPSKTKTTSASKSQPFIMPVFGQVSFEYAKDRLQYSKTLEEWRTHTGLDIAAERGTPVKVVADGIVTDIKNDPRFGFMVIVDHQNGMKTVYANLASDDMVSPNQIVKQGDVIGSIGDTAVFESVEQSHLHFEVLKNGENVNPESLLPKKTK